jgi:heme/copper-type cytochrome/quinol oxidase subunit 3
MSNADATSDAASARSDGAELDPVRARRAKVARWTLLANRIGYLFVALSIALFVIAFAVGFGPTLATLVTASFVIGCVLLAPSIIVGYAVKAAEREDRERGL